VASGNGTVMDTMGACVVGAMVTVVERICAD
jgi:hypothetical protein